MVGGADHIEALVTAGAVNDNAPVGEEITV